MVLEQSNSPFHLLREADRDSRKAETGETHGNRAPFTLHSECWGQAARTHGQLKVPACMHCMKYVAPVVD